MILVYRIGWRGGDAIVGPPAPVWVEVFGHPHFDHEGVQQTENTHFRSQRSAWEALRRNADQCVAGFRKQIEHQRLALEQLEQQRAEFVELRNTIEVGFDEWKKDPAT